MRSLRFGLALAFICSGLSVSTQARAEDLTALKSRLVVARQKFDRLPKVDMTKRPVESPYAEFAGLVEESHEALKKECDQLLTKKKKDEDFNRRLSDFVQVAALSVYLNPGHINAEIALRLAQSKVPFQKRAFQGEVNRLDRVLKTDFLEALQIEERSQREGNG